jgi:diaminopimelate decarboxylase
VNDPAVEDGGRDVSVERLLAKRADMLRLVPEGLLMEGVPLAEIAARSGTPTWVLGAATIRARHGRLAAALAAHGIGREAIHYAVKANDHLAVLSLMAGLGAGADAVSVGEIRRALAAGMAPARIVFSGVGKTRAELDFAVRAGVGQVNVESVEELHTLASAARDAGQIQNVVLRVNPDVDAGTLDQISTGRAGDKFGIPIAGAPDAYALAAGYDGLRAVGFAVHIGSQIMDAAPFERAFGRIAELVRRVRDDGLPVETVDAGGGLGICYGDGEDGDPALFAGALAGCLGGLGLRLAVEPGRWLVGPAGILLARVVRIKQAEPAPFMILDAAMNDLTRPSLYDAWHGVVPVLSGAPGETRTDIVGPVCESTDVLARGRLMPTCAEGAVVAILDTGAYGAVMSSTYNARPLAEVVLVEDGRWSVIRPRQPVEALWRDETLPGWFTA